MVVVPLRHDAQTAGALKVYSGIQSAFQPEQVRVLMLLADMIGSVLARAALLEKLEKRATPGKPPDRRGHRRHRHCHLEPPRGCGVAPLPRRRSDVRGEERRRVRYAVLSPRGQATPVPPSPQ